MQHLVDVVGLPAIGEQLASREVPAQLHMAVQQVKRLDSIACVRQGAAVGVARSAQPLNDRPEERPGTAGRLDEYHLGKITIGRVPDHVEHGVNHPPAGEDLTVSDGLLERLRQV